MKGRYIVRYKYVLTSLLIFSQLAGVRAGAAETRRINGEHWAACDSKENLDKLIRFAVQKDNEAFTKMLVSGKCVALKNGEQVFLEDIHIFSGVAEIRKKGSTSTLWTTIEAIQHD